LTQQPVGAPSSTCSGRHFASLTCISGSPFFSDSARLNRKNLKFSVSLFAAVTLTFNKSCHNRTRPLHLASLQILLLLLNTLCSTMKNEGAEDNVSPGGTPGPAASAGLPSSMMFTSLYVESIPKIQYEEWMQDPSQRPPTVQPADTPTKERHDIGYLERNF
jgi:hypothetical protein